MAFRPTEIEADAADIAMARQLDGVVSATRGEIAYG